MAFCAGGFEPMAGGTGYVGVGMSDSIISIVGIDELTDDFFRRRREDDGDSVAASILAAVRDRGDEAVREYAARFDRANPVTFCVDAAAVHAAGENLLHTKPSLHAALCRSRDLALSFARRQKESFDDFELELAPGLITAQKTVPVQRAGVYVPAGRFPLLSSVIMGLTPAQAAGVDGIILCSPPMPHPGGNPDLPWIDERIMAVATICGVQKVFAVGGAQAIAAMAFGTALVPAVQVIVGPGNRYVASAKKLVYGQVGIDLVAGPTEVMIIADATAHPEWVAADMLAQAEHDADAQAILVTDSASVAREVQAQISRLVDPLSKTSAARQSLAHNSAIIIVENLRSAVQIANRKAPEHLELALDAGPDRDFLESAVRNYGSLFVGHRSAEVLGDYCAGLNHTLPTSGSAAFTGGLSVRHFLKTVTVLRSDANSAGASGWRESIQAAALIADAEGLTGHALAARVRL